MNISSGTYTGTYEEIKPGKIFNLAFDSSSYANFISALEADADTICGLGPGSQSIAGQVDKFVAKLKKRQTVLKLTLKMTGTRTEEQITSNVAYSFKAKIDFNSSGCGHEQKWSKKQTIMNAVLTSDLNTDGAMDIVFTEENINYKVTNVDFDDRSADIRVVESSYAVLYLQDPLLPGIFLRQPEYTISPAVKTKRGLGTLVFSVADGDLDSDGVTDIAVTHKGNNSVGVFIQDPGHPGQLMPINNFPAVPAPVDVAIGDLNGDGINDMAVAGEYLALMMNDPLSPGGTFLESTPGVENVSSVAIADINNDGRNDLATTSGDTVIVLFQDSAPATPGSFTTGTSYPAGSGAADVAIGDLNGDSLPDLAVANRGNTNGSVSVHMQDSLATGTFQPGMHYLTGVNSQAVVIDDLNSDALPDLAVANNDREGGSVSVLLQDALNRGVFLAADDYPGMRGPNDIATDDMNGDGLVDLVVADKCTRPEERPYMRQQDINNPGNFLYPVPLP
jgi:hypothetical protein